MRDKNRIVIFDWGGVVESHREGEYNVFNARTDIIKSLIGNKLSENAITKKWNECNHDENNKCISEIYKKEDIQKWFERIKKSFGIQCNYDEFYAMYQEKFDKIEYYKDVVKFAHSLKYKCKIGILSNLSILDKNRIDKHYNLSKFDYVWLSFEMECKKPKEEICIKVENDCKIEPTNILFIDDVMENLIPAQKRGWNICNADGYEIEKIKNTVENFLITDGKIYDEYGGKNENRNRYRQYIN